MNSETFIQKYKPYNLEDMKLQNELHVIIRKLFEMDTVNVLFIGPSNSGKTTLLYCIIREYYGLKKTDKFPNNNIMFINNLKEQGINYYRSEMKNFCRSHSTVHGKKKLVVIDDMDTLHEQNQQVFRNYIDKYKKNVNFICVCSNKKKVIESIQSRLVLLHIDALSINEIENIMNQILSNENIMINNEAKKHLLRLSNNNVRRLIYNLEKLFIYNISTDKRAITLNVCKNLCSNISIQQFEVFVQELRMGNLYEAIMLLYKFHDYGYSVIDILEFFFHFVKNTSIMDENEKYKCTPYICEYITIFHKHQEDVIELAIFTNDIIKFFYHTN